MKIIIPSLDRSCQLHLLLESLQKNWKQLRQSDILVIYKCSDEKYQAGYEYYTGEISAS